MIFSLNSQVIIQGISGSLGKTYAPLIRNYGTSLVAGVSPGYGGSQIEGIPVFDMVDKMASGLRVQNLEIKHSPCVWMKVNWEIGWVIFKYA